MRGTVITVNRAMIRPILLAGVEKRLVILNAVFCYPLVAITQFRMPGALVGIVLFIVTHMLLTVVSKNDPRLGMLFKRSTRYLQRPYFPAVSHPQQTAIWPIKTISTPW